MMEIRNFKKRDHKTIKASFNVFIPEWNLYLNKFLLVEAGNGKFISMPSESYEKDGEKKYFPYFCFGKESNEAFKNKIMELIKPLLKEEEKESYTQSNCTYDDDLPF
jgi:hypothetical protein